MGRTDLFRRLKKAVKQARRESFQKDLSVGRRDFLKYTALGAAAAIPAFQQIGRGIAWAQPLLTNSSRDPVLILGAGAAGLAAAYTFKKANAPFILAEASSRVGGRIFTKENFNVDGQFIERGAELVDTNHTVLRELAKEVGLEIEDFDDTGVEQELYYIGNQIYNHGQLVKGLGPLIEAIVSANKEINVDGTGVTYKNQDNAAAVKYDNMTMSEFLDRNCINVDSWVRQVIEIAYLGEYGREVETQSAYNLICVLDDTDLTKSFNMFGESDECSRVKGGNGQLTNKLLEALGPNPDSFLRLAHQLVSMKERGSQIVCTFKNGKDITASQVICTIPFTVLREVNLNELSLSAVKRRCIDEMTYGTGSKICMSFQSRFWRQPTKNIPASSGLLYGDFPSQEFWETSRVQNGTRGILTNFLGGKAGLKCDHTTVDTAVNDLEKVYPGLAKHQYENRTIFTNWHKNPFNKGSYAALSPGQYTTIWGAAGEPELGGRLQFAGEHTSRHFQGFMNGAYATGIRAAKVCLAEEAYG